jgi:hypothetical protein
MGGIREDYVVGFAGPRPQEIDCGPWLIALYYQQSPIIFEMSAPITARRMRAFGCFRHQLLLCRQRHPSIIDTDQDGRLSKLDFLRQPKKHRRREDLP